MVLWKFSLREVRKHPLRAMLTLAGVAIGVGAAVAVLVCVKSTRLAYAEMFRTTTGNADLEVVAEGGGNVDLRALPIVGESAGVAAAVPVISKGTTLWPVGGEQVNATLLGVDPLRDRQVRDYEIVAGTELTPSTEGILVESEFAASNGIGVGDQVGVLTLRGTLNFPVVGFMRLKTASGIRGGSAVLMPLPWVQQHWRMARSVSSILLVLAEDVNESAATEAVQQRLDQLVAQLNQSLPADSARYSRLLVQRPADRSPYVDETLRAAETGLNLAAALSLLVAFFIIFNTFMMNVSERRRQLAIMRALGATRGQLRRMIVVEALVLGTAGALLGLALGLAGGGVLTAAMERLFQSKMPLPQVTWDVALLAAGVGLGTSLLGAYWPARKAGKLTPLEGMSGVAVEDRERVSWLMPAFALASLTAAGCVLVLSRWEWLPPEASIPAALSLLVGMVLLAPLMLRPACHLADRFGRPLLGVEGKLACRQLVRRRLRSSLTIGVLFVATGTGTGMANNLLNNIADVRDWYRRLVVADFFVRARLPDFSTGRSAEIPAEFANELKDIQGIAATDTLRMLNCKVNGQEAMLLVRQFTLSDDHAHLDVVDGDPAQVQERLLAGDLALSSVLAQRLGLTAGDKLTLTTRNGPRQFHICAITNEYLLGGVVLFMARNVAKLHFDFDGADYYLVRAQPDLREHVEVQLRQACQRHRLVLQSYAEITGMVEHMMAGVNAGLWAILAVGFVVSAFGIVNTLTMNVLEQTRELGLLRIIAMTRFQMRKTVLSQALLIGVLGLLPGIAAGVALDRMVNISTSRAFGHAIEFQYHPLLLLSCLFGGLLVVLGAGWLPAERAVRVNLLQAVKAE